MRLLRLIDVKETINYWTKAEIVTIPGHYGRIWTVGIHKEK